MSKHNTLDKKEKEDDLVTEDRESRSRLKLQLACFTLRKKRTGGNDQENDGVHNTKFFHITASNQRRNNNISGMFINHQLVFKHEKI